RGSFAWIKSALIYPLFMRYGLSSKPFAATSACTGCGKCARNCPTATVVMQGNRPLWNGRRCAMCERCYHACPVHAVKYGTATKGKGQYMYDAYARESGCPDVEGRLP
ncbi:MAG: EFR1 family ferrodoxin, partial [Muribaculaceae bacterium]|nr:EFR1 family ferrodoxin [Muribaculaceae bacterium]